MAYGRKMAGSALNKLAEMDASYAKAIDDRFGLSDPKRTSPLKAMQGMTSAVPIRDIVNNPYQEDRSKMTRGERAMDMGMDAAVLTSNLAARYGLPAGGVTLAGIGLYEAGQAMVGLSQQTQSTIPPV